MRRTAFLITFGAATGWSLSVAAGPLEQAAELYKKEDYSGARTIWEPLADQGNATAQTYLGILYENGWGVPKDATKSRELYQKAADQDEPEAEFRLGEAFILDSAFGGSAPHDPQKGIALIEKAASHGNPHYMVSLGDFFQRGWWGVGKDEKRAVENFRKAADLGYSLGEAKLALAYDTGQGVERDPIEAQKLYSRAAQHDMEAAQAGDLLAQLSVAQGYSFGVAGYKYDPNAALEWYRKAATHPGRLKNIIDADIARLEKRLNERP